jgi:hypothetical protein
MGDDRRTQVLCELVGFLHLSKVACMSQGRRFIGIERDRRYFDLACERIENALRQGRLSV